MSIVPAGRDACKEEPAAEVLLQASSKGLAGRVFFCCSSQFTVGLICLGLTVVLWSVAGFLIEYILSDFAKPFFLTYFSVATFQFYFVGIYVRHVLAKRKLKKKHDTMTKRDEEHIACLTNANLGTFSPDVEMASTAARLVPLTKKETLRLGFYFFVVYFAAAYLTNASYHYSDVVSASILLSNSCFFTLFLCIIFHIDSFSAMKGLSVMACAIGLVVLFTKAHQTDSHFKPGSDPLKGNMYAIASAFLYGVYSVMIKKVVIEESRIDMPLFFGIVGLLSTVLLWPLFILFHYTGFEVFELPSISSVGLLAVNNLLGTLLSSYCWAVAVLYTSPLVVAIGIGLCNTLTIILDAIFNGRSVISYYALTSLFILTGFLIVNLCEIYPKFNYFWEERCGGAPWFTPERSHPEPPRS